MLKISLRTIKRICALLVVIGLNDMTHTSLVAAQLIIQPGALVAPTRTVCQTSDRDWDTSYTAGDAQFMRDMIPHHQQALAMSRLAPSRTNSTAILDIAARIEAAQGDEIAFMGQGDEPRRNVRPTTKRARVRARHNAHGNARAN